LRAPREYSLGRTLLIEAAKDPNRYKEAAEHFRRAADAGHIYSLVALSGLYRRGQGVPLDIAEADALIDKVKLTSDPELLYHVAMTYVTRPDVKPPECAMELFRRSAEQGNVYSQNGLGYALMLSIPDGADPTEAMMWLLVAAAEGQAEAQANLKRLLPSLTPEEIEWGRLRAKAFRPRREKAEGDTK
jgi:TPR repeat protein